MTKELKDKHELIHYRSVAGCIHQGWVLLAEHPWAFIRGGAPILLLAALVGVGLGLALPWCHLPWVKYVLLALFFLLMLLWIIQVAGLVYKFHQQGYFPSLRPLFKGKRNDNRITAFTFWKADWKQATRSTLRLFVLMLKSVRQWGSLLGILIVGGIVCLCLTLAAALPYCILSSATFSSHFGELMGDTVELPTLMPLYAIVSGIICVVISTLSSLFLLLPLAYFAGSLTKEQQERISKKSFNQNTLQTTGA